MKSLDKLIIKHALNVILNHIDHQSFRDQELLKSGTEFTISTGKEISEDPGYQELLKSLCELTGIKY